MQIKKYIAGLAFGVLSLMSAHAQDLMPEKLPAHPVAERIVKEVAPVRVEENTSVEIERTVSYNAGFGESVVRTALQYLGARYSRGSSGPNVFDCSGFTHVSFTVRKTYPSYAHRAHSSPKARPLHA